MARAAPALAVISLAASLVAVSGSAARAELQAATSPSVLSATTQSGSKYEIVVAHGDGTGVRVLGSGIRSLVSPNGSSVAVVGYQAGSKLTLYATASGRAVRSLGGSCLGVFWSPDSKELACVDGGYGKINHLLLITVATGARTTLATGWIDSLGVAFSPASTELAYVQLRTSRSVSGQLKVIDLASHAVTKLRAGAKNPVWGKNAIAFATLTTQGQHSSANLAVIQPNGTGFRQLTSGQQPGPAPVFGYEPVAWSANGSQLLAFYGGGQVATAIAVDPIHGGTRLISGAVWPRALSRDGSYVVGETPVATSDGFVARTNVLRVPWAGGNARVLLRKAMTPSFTG